MERRCRERHMKDGSELWKSSVGKGWLAVLGTCLSFMDSRATGEEEDIAIFPLPCTFFVLNSSMVTREDRLG